MGNTEGVSSKWERPARGWKKKKKQTESIIPDSIFFSFYLLSANIAGLYS